MEGSPIDCRFDVRRYGASVTASPSPRALPAAYALAQVGSFVSFMPLLTILLPLKVSELAPDGRTALLSQLLFWGAISAGAASMAVGALSDRTRGRFGRRRPWIVAGLAGTILSYAAIAGADRPDALMVAVIAFQVALNMLLGPLAAVMADAIPAAQRGRVGAVAALGVPLGITGGALLVSGPGEGAPYLVIALVLVTSVLPLLFVHRDRTPPQAKRAVLPAAPLPGDFVYAWAMRALFVLVSSLCWSYMLFYLEARAEPPARAVDQLARLTSLWGAAHVGAAFLTGWWSDRLGRRKPFVAAAGLALAAAGAVLAWGSGPAVLALAFALLGLGAGAFQALDAAVMTAVLPGDGRTAARLGLLNLANIAPQVVAPALAIALLGAAGAGFDRLFAAAGVLALLAGATVVPMRSVDAATKRRAAAGSASSD